MCAIISNNRAPKATALCPFLFCDGGSWKERLTADTPAEKTKKDPECAENGQKVRGREAGWRWQLSHAMFTSFQLAAWCWGATSFTVRAQTATLPSLCWVGQNTCAPPPLRHASGRMSACDAQECWGLGALQGCFQVTLTGEDIKSRTLRSVRHSWNPPVETVTTVHIHLDKLVSTVLVCPLKRDVTQLDFLFVS